LAAREKTDDFAGTARFAVVRRVGHGGAGIVYEASDRENGVRVALKRLRRLSPEAILRFKSEFRSVEDVEHPNLVALGELFEEAGAWFFTMEYVEGVDLLSRSAPAIHGSSRGA
jgi:serine/threonine protein kinase